jgi:hypothetical protein
MVKLGSVVNSTSSSAKSNSSSISEAKFVISSLQFALFHSRNRTHLLHCNLVRSFIADDEIRSRQLLYLGTNPVFRLEMLST